MLGACVRVTVVSLSVCLTVCYHSSTGVRCVCNKLNSPARSLLHSKGFQQTGFAKKLLF